MPRRKHFTPPLVSALHARDQPTTRPPTHARTEPASAATGTTTTCRPAPRSRPRTHHSPARCKLHTLQLTLLERRARTGPTQRPVPPKKYHHLHSHNRTTRTTSQPLSVTLGQCPTRTATTELPVHPQAHAHRPLAQVIHAQYSSTCAGDPGSAGPPEARRTCRRITATLQAIQLTHDKYRHTQDRPPPSPTARARACATTHLGRAPPLMSLPPPTRRPAHDPSKKKVRPQSMRLILRELKREREFEGQACANSVAGKRGTHQNASEKVGHGRMLESGFAYGSGGAKTRMREQRAAVCGPQQLAIDEERTRVVRGRRLGSPRCSELPPHACGVRAHRPLNCIR